MYRFSVDFFELFLYASLQLYLVLSWRGGWRIASLVPFPVVVFAMGDSVVRYFAGSGLWPVLLFSVGPPALAFLVMLLPLRAFFDSFYIDIAWEERVFFAASALVVVLFLLVRLIGDLKLL